MKIQTDFTPKPGDKVRHRRPSGQIATYVFAICPDCSEGRWISISNFNRPGFDGCCQKCNLIRAKKAGWPIAKQWNKMDAPDVVAIVKKLKDGVRASPWTSWGPAARALSPFTEWAKPLPYHGHQGSEFYSRPLSNILLMINQKSNSAGCSAFFLAASSSFLRNTLAERVGFEPTTLRVAVFRTAALIRSATSPYLFNLNFCQFHYI